MYCEYGKCLTNKKEAKFSDLKIELSKAPVQDTTHILSSSLDFKHLQLSN